MISVAEAYRIIQSKKLQLQKEVVEVIDSVGHVLAEEIKADRDFPPFDRVAMDGIAIHADHFQEAGQHFKVEATQAAGSPQLQLTNSNNCIEVMTGAMLPRNTNAVVRYEDLEIREGVATIRIDKVEAGLNIHKQGDDSKQGDVLLTSGQIISAAEVALLASVGKDRVTVFKYPKTAIISTGDELVDITSTPAAHQIRRSNVYALQADLKQIHWSSDLFHLIDDALVVKSNLEKILAAYDVLILTGGVSKGKFDFIPRSLELLGIQKIFHQVGQRPGKPFWFGASPDSKKVVFALPGNPVSTFMCFYKYIKPWILGCCSVKQKASSAVLSTDLNFAPQLTYFLQVRTEVDEGRITAHPHAGGGSGDFVNLKEVDGFLELPAEKSAFKAGEAYPYISFR
jgi:molybdopterin molybdotransferase